MITKKYYSLILLLFATIFTDCRRDTVSICTTCKQLPPDKRLTIQVGEEMLYVKTWKSNEHYQFAYAVEDSNLEVIAQHVVQPKGAAGEQLAAIVLYLTENPDDSAAIKDSSVAGYGIYFIAGGYLQYRFYIKQSGFYQVVSKLSCETTALSSNDIYNVARLYFKNEEQLTALAIANNSVLFRTNNSKEKKLTEELAILLNQQPAN